MQAFRQRHDCGNCHGRRSANEDIHLEGNIGFDGLSMVVANPSMDLVVQPHFLIGLVVTSRKLHPLHAQIGESKSRLFDAFGVDLGQGNIGASVLRP